MYVAKSYIRRVSFVVLSVILSSSVVSTNEDARMWQLRHAHKWMMRPETAYERRRELRVRESRHTLMLFNKRYQNIDTGKFELDRLPTIQSYSLGEIIDDCIHNNMSYGGYTESRYRDSHYSDEDSYSPIYNFPKFIPKDNDFDDEEDVVPPVPETSRNGKVWNNDEAKRIELEEIKKMIAYHEQCIKEIDDQLEALNNGS